MPHPPPCRRVAAPAPRLAALLLGAALLLVPAQALHAQQTGSIAGTVVDLAEAPLSDVRVQATTAGRPAVAAVTRAGGAFRLDGLAPGAWVVTATGIGFAPSRDTVQVAAGQTATIRLVLERGASTLEAVTITGVTEAQTVFEAPASISVVGEQQIEERPALTAADNLAGVPGVDVAKGGLVQSAIVARGFNNAFSGAMLTLIDHRFASVPSLRVNVPFLFTAGNEDIERIEVLLGPAAALYGPNSANGVLHLITKSPFNSQGTTLTVDGGERSVMRGALRHAGVVGGSLGYKLSGEFMRGKDWEYFDPAEPANFPATPNTPAGRIGQPNVRDFDVERWGGEARVDYRFANGAEWINTYGLTHAGSSLELTGANGTAQVKGWTMQSLQSRFRSGRLFLQAFANLSDAGNEDSLDLGGTYLLRTGQPIVDQSRTLAAQAQHGFEWGRATLAYGVDYIFTNPRTGGTINGRNEEDDDVTEVGGYVQASTPLGTDFELLLAARLDRHSELEGNFFSPRAALIYNVTPDQNVRLTFNRAYSTPANFSFFLDLLQAGNSAFGGLPYNVRAVGVPSSGFTFRRDCTGGVGSLCMRSPFTPAAAGGPGQFVPANAAAYYQAALQAALAGGLRQGLIAQGGLSGDAADAVIRRLQEFNAVGANVGTSLRYITNNTVTTPEEVTDIERLKASFTNVLEVGYKGRFDRFRLAVDGWWQQRENFITPAVNFTPNALLDGPTLGGALGAHLAPVVGAQNAAALAPVVAGALARVPLGTVVPDSRVTTNGDIAFTYRNIDETIDFYGFDLAFDVNLTDDLMMLGTFSHVSESVFPEIPSGQAPLTLNAPDNKGSLAFGYNHRPANLSVEVRGRWQNTFPVNSAVFVTGTPCESPGVPTGCVALTAADGSTYAYEQPPTSTFLDAQIVWRLPFGGADQALLSISGTNLTDRKVPMFAGVPSIGRLIMSRLQVSF